MNWQTRLGETPLMGVASSNSTDTMEVLLHHGADPSIKDKDGLTALDEARSRNHEEAIWFLGNIR